MMFDNEINRQVVYYLGLCEIVEARLATSPKYGYAVRALDAAWRWVEHQDLSGAALADLDYDEEGFGVSGSMAVEKDKDLMPAWTCVAMAIGYAAFAAYLAEGSRMREDIENADSEKDRDTVARLFRTMVPLETMLAHYQNALDLLPVHGMTRSVVRDWAFAALHAAAADSAA